MSLPVSQINLSFPSTRLQSKTFQIFTKHPQKFNQISFKPHLFKTILRSSQEDDPPTTDIQNESDKMTDLGMEIKKAMNEREEKESSNLLSGVAEEIREIEWPAFNKVLATTGVVLGVIAGSSVVLLTVNAVLAELSDGIFAGKGVQDFFG